MQVNLSTSTLDICKGIFNVFLKMCLWMSAHVSNLVFMTTRLYNIKQVHAKMYVVTVTICNCWPYNLHIFNLFLHASIFSMHLWASLNMIIQYPLFHYRSQISGFRLLVGHVGYSWIHLLFLPSLRLLPTETLWL